MEPVTTCLQNPVYDLHRKYYDKYKNVVYNRTRKRLSRYRSRLGQQDVEDLLQETFCSAFRWMKNYFAKHNQFPTEEIFEVVLRAIEINEYRSYLKRVKLYHACMVSDGNGYNGSEGHGSRFPHDTPAGSLHQSKPLNPEENFLWKEYEAQLERCLKKLRSQESAALLCKAKGDSDKEIAALLDADEGRVTHSIIPLGRKKLRKCIGSYIHGNRKPSL